MSIVTLTDGAFDETINGSQTPVLVDFWAEWCGPCKAIGPSVEQLAVEYEGRAKVYKLDVDSNGEIAERYGVMSIPALLVFKNGKVVELAVKAAVHGMPVTNVDSLANPEALELFKDLEELGT